MPDDAKGVSQACDEAVDAVDRTMVNALQKEITTSGNLIWGDEVHQTNMKLEPKWLRIPDFLRAVCPFCGSTRIAKAIFKT